MHDNIQLIIIGLGSGAAYAVLAIGLVVVFRGSGVLNFAHGAIASVGAYVFLDLAGDHGWSTPLAAATGVAASTLVGVLFQFLVMRRLKNAPALAKVVATLGLLVGLIAFIPLTFSDRTRAPISLFSGEIRKLPVGQPKLIIPNDRMWLVIIACVLTAVVWAVFRYTNFGKVTRAVSENERAVSTLGYSPQAIALANWAIGSALAGVAGVLLAGLVVQSETMLTEILMAGLAAALIGGFKSFAITLPAAFGLSALQSLLIRYSSDLTNATTIVGWGDIAPFLVILVYMTVRGAPIPLRGALIESRLPTVPVVRRPIRAAAIVLVVGVVLYVIVGARSADALTVTLIGGMVCLSLVVVVGFLGQVSVIQMALAGLGAFWASKAATSWGLPFPLPVLIGGLLVVPFGVAAAIPALRVRGINLAVITISAAFALDASFFSDVRLNLGAKFPAASIFGIDMSGVRSPQAFGIAVLVIALLLALGVAYLRRSALGITFLALRANERGASALGVSLVRTKLFGFAIAAFIAGVAGSLYGYRAETLSFGTFAAFQSLLVIAFVYLGGVGAIIGAFIGAANLSGAIFPHVLHFEGTGARVMQIIGGVGVMLTVVAHPDGVALLPRDLRHHRRDAKQRKLIGIDPPPASIPEPAGERAIPAAARQAVS